MKIRHLMTAALGALMLSCQGPAAVMAQETAAGAAEAAVGADPRAAITEAHRMRALDTLDRRLAHYVRGARIAGVRSTMT